MMRRREFLRATLATATAVIAGSACSDEQIGGACSAEQNDTLFPQSVASGDPKPDSVILWTRIEDPLATGDLSLQLALALDEDFTNRVAFEDGSTSLLVTAKEAFDHCVKVKVVGLTAGTTYYYRFFYAQKGACYTSRVGKTKTAPKEDANETVRFAFVSCQDYVGRYYNAHLALAKQQLDFFVHLGDYIYETSGDPRFQAVDSPRAIKFTDEENAIKLSAAGGDYFAAKSLSNYRELYRTYRSDPALQRVHELFPMIAIWDDHEFSDDSHGATACYTDGREDETDIDRRKAANQAWFEYMPVDYPRPADAPDDEPAKDFEYDATIDPPNDIKIYRDFKFGKHLHLVMTDLRSYREDHLIPEDAFPGQVIAIQTDLDPVPLPPIVDFYIDIGAWPLGDTPTLYKDALIEAAPTLGFDPADITGNLNARFVDALVARINDELGGTLPRLNFTDPLNPATYVPNSDLGIAYVNLGKRGFYSSIGSRYLVDKDTFDIFSQVKYAETNKRSGTVMGEEQEVWFLNTIEKSASTWKVWGNEHCLMQLAIDLTGQTGIPEDFRRRYYMNCDSWDGFRQRRSELIERLSSAGNVVAITGDIHAFFAGTPGTDSDPTKKIVEFVGGAISTTVFNKLLVNQIENDPVLKGVPGATFLAETIDSSLQTAINPHLAFANSSANGFCVVEASPDELIVEMHQLPQAELETDYASKSDELDAKFTVTRLKTIAGGSDLYQEKGGTWQKWDAATRAWV